MSGKDVTKKEILKTSKCLFLQHGYDATTIGKISEELGISKGNLTYYFPTKEDLFLELVREAIAFQWRSIDASAKEEEELLERVCLNFAAMAALCHTRKVIKELFLAAYRSSKALQIIREELAGRARSILGTFGLHLTDEVFFRTESMISGMVYALLTSLEYESLSLSEKVAYTLDCILMLYGVPQPNRKEVIEKVLARDYQAIGLQRLSNFAAECAD